MSWRAKRLHAGRSVSRRGYTAAMPSVSIQHVRPATAAAMPPRDGTIRPALLAELAAGPSVSGSRLAARLGVSRAAVWKQIEQLRGLGLAIQARPGDGYRLAHAVDWLDAARIAADLDATDRHVADVAVHWQLDSTSSELLRRATSDARDHLACLAEVQSAGRGRRGRGWRLPLGGGIALSLLKRFDAGMAPLAGLSLVAGIAAVRALADCGVGGIGLKWPNDLVAGGRKLGGILVELGGDAIGPCHAVVGIGVNVRLGEGAGIDQPWTDLASLTPDLPSRNRLAARLVARLIESLDRFAESGFAAFAAEYARHDVLRDRPVQLLRGERRDCGLARGVDARGALRVAFADGERAIDSGEVSVRAQP